MTLDLKNSPDEYLENTTVAMRSEVNATKDADDNVPRATGTAENDDQDACLSIGVAILEPDIAVNTQITSEVMEE